jgi:HD-GYP domain-containing protein (c-di-GMP phosphodiesterase class II)
MRVLISFSDPTAMDVVALVLEGLHGAEVIVTESVDELGQSHLVSGAPPIDLIICEHPTRSVVVANLLRQQGLDIPLILFDGGKDTGTVVPEGVKILGRVSWSTWVNSIDGLLMDYKLPHEESDVIHEPDQSFHQIRTRLLVESSPLPAEVYIRLSESKYLRIFQADDAFDQADYDRYALQKKVGFFHLKRDALASFVHRLTASVQKRLEEGLSQDEASNFSHEIHQTAQILLRQGAPAPEVNELIKTNLNLTMQAIGKKPKLKEAIDRVLQGSQGYLGVHSVALCQITCTIASIMEWGSKATFSKLNFASFLHDSALDKDEHARIDSKEAIELLRASEGEDAAEAVLMHGVEANELSRKFNEVPPDVGLILLQHHERPDGSGFPRGLTHTQIAPMAALFIIAQDLVNEIFEKGPGFGYADFIEERQETYGMGHFKKVLKAISKI